MAADEVTAEFFADPAGFEAWLERHAEHTQVWVRMAKKHTGLASLDWDGAVDVALCFGWIDGISRRVDDQWFVQRFTPRRPRSLWSKLNRQRVERLAGEGRMRPAGLAEVERAKADGRWDAAYDGPAGATVPDDLAQALQALGLTEMFAGLDATNRYAILHRVQTAQRPQTRAARIERLTTDLARGVLPYPRPATSPKGPASASGHTGSKPDSTSSGSASGPPAGPAST